MSNFNLIAKQIIYTTKKETSFIKEGLWDSIKKISGYTDAKKMYDIDVAAQNYNEVINNFEQSLKELTELARETENHTLPENQLQAVKQKIGQYLEPVTQQYEECKQKIITVRSFIRNIDRKNLDYSIPSHFDTAEERLLETLRKIELTIAFIKREAPTATANSNVQNHPFITPKTSEISTVPMSRRKGSTGSTGNRRRLRRGL